MTAPKTRLSRTKEKVRKDIERLIAAGIAIDGEVFPQNFHHVEVRGKSVQHLQVRVFYRDQAPIYFNVEALGVDMV